MPGFIRQAVLYVGVFALSTAIVVVYRFTEERLGLFWRVWLTRRIIGLYFSDRTYLHLKEAATVENPDQRIAEDVRTFTATTLSFTLMFMNGALAVLSFSGVLWTISPFLFGVALGYAVIGTLATIYLGRPLIGVNYRQSDREATFRSDLIHVRENAESIALLRREGRLTARLLQRIEDLADNFRRIVAVNRNLSFFTTGYNYLIQIIPMLIVAPLFIRGKVEFGVITQSAMAFTTLLRRVFLLIINQFQSISSFAAVIRTAKRAGRCAVEERAAIRPDRVALVRDDGRIAYEGLTLNLPEGAGFAKVLKKLTADIPARDEGIDYPDQTEAAQNGPVPSYRPASGPRGVGTLVRPAARGDLFLPQQPVPSTEDTPGTPPPDRARSQVVTDDEITAAPARGGSGLPPGARAGGLDSRARLADHALGGGAAPKLLAPHTR